MTENSFSLKTWFIAVRPKTLIISVCPVLIGSALAGFESFDLIMFVFILLASLFIQIGTNIANDYYDFIQGADTKERVGPKRVTQSGLLDSKTVKKGFIYSFILAFIFGLYPVYKGGPVILALGIVSILLGIYYTKGKYSLGYTGVADLFVLLFFGVFSTGFTYYLHTLEYLPKAFISGLGPGALAVAILCLNNLRDEKEDKKTGKKTLIARFGPTFGKVEYGLCLTTAFLVLLAYCPLVCWIFALPASFLHNKLYLSNTSYELIQLLEKTAKLLLFYTLLFIVGSLL